MSIRTNSHDKTINCFISMPFSSDFDNVFIKGISSITNYLSDYKIDLIRLDKQVYARRSIEGNVLKHIDESDMLIADITRYTEALQPNVSVMHEIGYAAGKDIPFILIGRKDTYKNLPSNIKGSLIVEYDSDNDPDLKKFTILLVNQTKKVIEDEVLEGVRGDFRVACFSDRYRINIPRLIEKAKHRIYILTTNLEYTNQYLTDAITKSLDINKSNAAFKIEILTMDPESDVANARAIQLGRTIRQYRNELRENLDKAKEIIGKNHKVEIVTYRSLPTQMTFIVDDIVITAVVSLGQQSREGIHFVLSHTPKLTEPFLAHFRALKTLAVANI